MKKVELLAPAGDLEKLKMAFLYGADAVYIGGEEFGLRAAAGFDLEDMKKGVDFAHSIGKRVYLTMNIIPHNHDLLNIEEYLTNINKIGIDAIILSDPGVYAIVKQVLPQMEIHLSTQANNTNWRSCKFWYEHGVKRIVLARELSLDEIKEINEMNEKKIELEVFVHGAMCISYSGRCLLSSYMSGRDANKGACAHPCRWKYHLVEEKRPGEYMPVYENERGTYIFNSKDLCTIEYIPQIIESGVVSLKIEGRMKSQFYVATIVSAYRQAIDSYYKDPKNYEFNPKWLEEVKKVSHREYTTGFYLNKTGQSDQIYNTSSYVRNYDFVGLVLDYDKNTKIAKIEQRNRIFLQDEIEILRPNGTFFNQMINNMKNKNGEDINVAPNAQMIVYISMEEDVEPYSIIRKKANEMV